MPSAAELRRCDLKSQQAGLGVLARKRINLSVARSVSHGSTWKRLELEGVWGA